MTKKHEPIPVRELHFHDTYIITDEALTRMPISPRKHVENYFLGRLWRKVREEGLDFRPTMDDIKYRIHIEHDLRKQCQVFTLDITIAIPDADLTAMWQDDE